MSEIKPYRPSNGSEGDCFTAHFCDRCVHDKAARAGDYENGCEILCRSLAFGIDHELYPTEWQRIDGEPTCTAFREDSNDGDADPQPDPDPSQLVLIADPTEDIALATEPSPASVVLAVDPSRSTPNDPTKTPVFISGGALKEGATQ